MKLFKTALKRIRGELNLKKLKKRGLNVGDNFKHMGECIIDPSHCWHIEIGNDVIFAPRVHILAHDAGPYLFIGYTKVANVKIGNRVFVGAGTIVLPGVSIGDDVVIGAGSVVSSDIPSNSLAVGSPARVKKSLKDYISEEKLKMKADNVFSEQYTLRNPQFSDKHKKTMLDAILTHDQIFVE